jgi:hypothetical protein
VPDNALMLAVAWFEKICTLRSNRLTNQPRRPMQARDKNVIWAGGGEPPGGHHMQARSGKLEALADKIAERLGSLARGVAVIKSN